MTAWTDGWPIPAPPETSHGPAALENLVVGGKLAGIVARLLHGTWPIEHTRPHKYPARPFSNAV